MLFQKTNVDITAVDYDIDYDPEKKIATITPTVHIICTKTQIMIASINVDDHELRPSLKLVLEEGERSYVVPHVKIVNPFICSEENDSIGREYKMTLKLHLGNEETFDIDKNIKILDQQAKA